MLRATFTIMVTYEDAMAFAELSGDWNPLHTDSSYAKTSNFGGVLLHGAYLAGLISRLAGMYLPGEKCLLRGLNLDFIAPIFLPVELTVSGVQTGRNSDSGRVQVAINDTKTGLTYAEGSYTYGLHTEVEAASSSSIDRTTPHFGTNRARILVTGASGGLGRALIQELGDKALGVSRNGKHEGENLNGITESEVATIDVPLEGIVHCGWPIPDNRSLISLDNFELAVDYNVASPIKEILSLSQTLVEKGTENAPLILIGSSFAMPGRHNYRTPLYSIAKGMVPSICQILSLELAPKRRRCIAIVFDVLDGGMNRGMSSRTRVSHEDRMPFGRLPSMKEAALQILWVLDNNHELASGACMELKGGALP